MTISIGQLFVHIDNAILKVIREFLTNPFQFHGDSTIMHSWYHWARDSGKDLFFHTPAAVDAVPALLLRSEYATLLNYLDRGKTPSSGSIDYAFLNPDAIGRDGKIDTTLPALVGIEVGLHKSIDDMGDMTAPEAQAIVKPGDAAKVIREIRFRQMQAGYVLEFYDSPDEVNKAFTVYEIVKESLQVCDMLVRVVVIVHRGPRQSPMFAFHPKDWGETIAARIGREVVPLTADPRIDADRGHKTLSDFKQWCGPCNSALQDAISALPAVREGKRVLVYGRKSMTVNAGRTKAERVRIAQIGNRSSNHGESIYHISPQLATELASRQLPTDRITIPNDEDASFINTVTACLSAALAAFPTGDGDASQFEEVVDD